MVFVDRREEMKRLDRAAERREGALVVLWGRRRLGKTRLLTEWCRKYRGTYWVAEESAPAIQRRYLSVELARVFPGFSDVDYPDWNALFERLAREAGRVEWPGPLVIDEFPYLIPGSPELPSVLQRWMDRERREGSVVLALSGSSQRMMQGSILNAGAPLYGRAVEVLRINPLRAGYISDAAGLRDARAMLDYYTCWGGVPRYWELSHSFGADLKTAVDDLVLSPLGVLHDEVGRLLRQEMPSAVPLRPVLDAIGLGAHKSSEIAGRLQTTATSIARPLRQLQELGYVRRDVPFGESEKRSKKSVYELADPFLRLWFQVVAPHRGALRSASGAGRRKLLESAWSGLRARAWEEVCREAVPLLERVEGDWGVSGRYWRGNAGEWDVVSTSRDGSALLLGECKAAGRRIDQKAADKIVRGLMSKEPPALPGAEHMRKVYVIFVPAVEPSLTLPPGVHVVDGGQVFAALS